MLLAIKIVSNGFKIVESYSCRNISSNETCKMYLNYKWN